MNLESHLHRLEAGACELGWGVPWLKEVIPDLMAWISEAGTAACRMQLFSDALSVRLDTTWGAPGEGSHLCELASGRVRERPIGASGRSPSFISETQPPYRLIPLPHPLGDVRDNPRTAHKGILGDWDIQVRNQAHEGHAEDALLLWPDGTLAETAIASIGLQVGGDLFLPPLKGRVESITEALELQLWASAQGFALQRRPIALTEVSGGQLWCMNALRGLWQAEVVQLRC